MNHRSGKHLMADHRAAYAQRRPALATYHRPLTTSRSSAFTLVELLVTITIIAILAAMILFALAGALESAKRDKTLSTISKLNSLVMAKYETYRTRRVPVDVAGVARYDGLIAPAATDVPTKTAAQIRVDVIRELMRMEMPDRYSDIQDAPVTKMKMLDPTLPTQQMARPAANSAYLAALPAAPNFQFEAAKCLYLLVSHGLDDPDVMSQFSDDEIAIDDKDRLRYFVDGWGQPIFFVRWPAGFSSALQPWNVNPTDVFSNVVATKNYPTAHDPFDPLKAYIPTTASDPFYNPSVSLNAQVYPPLYPLIISGGPDRITDVYFNGVPNGSGTEFQYSITSPPNNPYVVVQGGLFGAPTDLPSIFTPSGVTTGDGVDNTLDNITNHDMSETQ